MPASTRPAARRTDTNRPPTRPRSTAGLYDPAIASDGLTMDTPLGPVDLVAVERAARGHTVALTEAERAWVVNRQVNGARRQAADAVGTGYTGLLRALVRYRAELASTTG